VSSSASDENARVISEEMQGVGDGYSDVTMSMYKHVSLRLGGGHAVGRVNDAGVDLSSHLPSLCVIPLAADYRIIRV